MRRDPRERSPLAHRLPRAPDVERLKVPQPAVNRPQMIERAAAPEVVALDQRHRQAALRRVVGDGQTVNAAADDEQIEGAGGETIEVANHWRNGIAIGAQLQLRAQCFQPESSELRYSSSVATIDAVRDYWNRHIHDLEITRHPVGSRGFFDDLDQYHFEKLHHLLRLVDFDGYCGPAVLEVGCGAGVDLARFAKGGALVSGVDLAASAIDLARANFEQQGLRGEFQVADGERLPFPDDSFDLVYAHGVVQYTADPQRLVDECRRVLKPGGDAIFQVYNRVSWLNALSKLMKVGLEHDDAPVLLKFSIGEFKRLVSGFRDGEDRARAVPGEVAAARRVEGDAVQHLLRRDVQRPPAPARAALRLALAGVLPEMNRRARRVR